MFQVTQLDYNVKWINKIYYDLKYIKKLRENIRNK